MTGLCRRSSALPGRPPFQIRSPGLPRAASTSRDTPQPGSRATDLVPVLRKRSIVMVDIADPRGNVGAFRMNHLHPPFNDVRARRAILMALSQEDYMRAYIGDDDNLWKPLRGFFTPGTPLYNEEGGEILKGPRNFEAAKRLLAGSGYSGQPVTGAASWRRIVSFLKAWGEVTADLLKRLGMNVDFAAIDWGTVVARRAQKSPPGQGGSSENHELFELDQCFINEFSRTDDLWHKLSIRAARR
jgi:peptide/nickel transport system substrate-binding protein